MFQRKEQLKWLSRRRGIFVAFAAILGIKVHVTNGDGTELALVIGCGQLLRLGDGWAREASALFE
eukprot:1450767-Pleurochrysis_carterae.AAC.1